MSEDRNGTVTDMDTSWWFTPSIPPVLVFFIIVGWSMFENELRLLLTKQVKPERKKLHIFLLALSAAFLGALLWGVVSVANAAA